MRPAGLISPEAGCRGIFPGTVHLATDARQVGDGDVGGEDGIEIGRGARQQEKGVVYCVSRHMLGCWISYSP